MKIIFLSLIICIALWSCSKTNDVKPGDNGTKTDTTHTTTPGNPSSLTHDDSVHMALFNIYTQKVKTSVSGKTLILTYNEDATLYMLADAYQNTYAVHLKEDFKKTSLAAFDFTTINGDGQTTFNSVDDNLNNVKFKTIKDTLIDGVNVKKINVFKPFTFKKVYDSSQLAIDQQNLLLGKMDELITFSSYTYYNNKTYPTTSVAAYIQYVK
ncbi:MAG TPA: hypothetical protein VIM55_08165 [Mucilaginibacter sp.]